MEQKLNSIEKVFIAPLVEVRSAYAQITGIIELLRQDIERNGFEILTSDLEKIAIARDNFLNLLIQSLIAMQESRDAVTLRKLRHDLKTPLGHMLGYAEMIMEELEDLDDRRGVVPLLREDLKRLLQSTRKLLAIINEGSLIPREAAEPSSQTSTLGQEFSISSAITCVRRSAEILVVDDSEGNREVLQKYLKMLGHTPTLAHDGASALALLDDRLFDLVLLDVMMPGIDGLAVLAKVKDNPKTMHIPIIMISAIDETETVAQCIEAGADDFLSKPFSPILLRARVDSCIEKKDLRDQEQKHLGWLEVERAKSEELLLNILPQPIAERLKSGQRVIADDSPIASVLFADVIGFTPISSGLSPEVLVVTLNMLFCAYDEITERLGVEKIKTIGDAYMVASGIPLSREDHAQVLVECGLQMLEKTSQMQERLPVPMLIRVGINSGPVVSGVIGRRKFAYDLWGDTVNLASRICGAGKVPGVRITEVTRSLVQGSFTIGEKEVVNLKGKGDTAMFIVERK